MANEKRLLIYYDDLVVTLAKQYGATMDTHIYSPRDILSSMQGLSYVDAVEVVHGRWEDNHCTACGMMPMGEELWEHLDCDPPRMEYFMDYCPSCGAKMRGSEE